MSLTTYFTGFGASLGLILAIGAQNAFVLRQGLKREHVLAVCLVCALSETLLVTVGITGFSTIARLLPLIEPVLRYGGAAFLVFYGARSLRSALTTGGALTVETLPAAPLSATIVAALALTFLNPHVYLDTVMLLGSISTRFEGEKPAFAAGAISASWLFFFTLGYGARLLRPVFSNPFAWRVLEAVIALVMWTIATTLILGGKTVS